MKLLRRLYGNLRFRNKIVLTSLILALVPLLIFAVAVVAILAAQGRGTAQEHTEQITRQVRDSIDTYISSIERTADYLNAQMLDIEGAVNLTGTNAQQEIGTMFANISATHPEIAGILVASGSDEYISRDLTRLSRDPFKEEAWYRAATQNPGRMVLVSNVAGRNIATTLGHSVDDVFSLAKALVVPSTSEVWGVLLIDVHHDILLESVRKVTIGERGFVYIADEEGNVVYTSAINQVVYRISPSLLEDGASAKNVRVQGQDYQLQVETSDYTGWRTVGVFSLDETMGGVYTLVYVLGLSVIIMVVLVLVVSFKLANSVTEPISHLQDLMQQAEKGDLNVRFNSNYDDEIGDLGRSFNHMLGRIDRLIQRVYVVQQHKRDAEMKILQEQIKPHFLYNTLDSIGWMAREHEADDIVRLVDALTNMFRVGLSRGKDSIPMRDELTHVSNYLYIQKIRYREKLTYHINADKNAQDFVVPKLILQPLVENAIYHGIKEKRGGGTVWVECRLAEDQKHLVLGVRDDGAGMAPAVLEELRSKLQQPSTSEEKPGFGLFYIEERLRMMFGKGCSVEVESVQGAGTSITVTLPCNEKRP